jgi:hypothetical protein
MRGCPWAGTPAEAKTRAQELRSDARVRAKNLSQMGDVGSSDMTDLGHGVDK